MAVSLAKCKLGQELYQVAEQVREVITNLVKEFYKIREALDKIEAEDSFKAHENPQVKHQIEGIKQFLRELTVYSSSFLSACKSLARYSSNDRHLQSIKDDLQNGSVEKLKRFIKDIINRTNRCHKCMDEYHVRYDELKTHIDQTINESSKKVERNQEKVRDLHIVSRGTGIASGVSGTGAAIAGACSVAVFGVSSVFPPSAIIAVPVGIISLAISGVLTFAAVGSGGVAIGFAVVKSVTEKERKILQQASDSVQELQKTMNKSKIKVEELEARLKTISDIIKGSTVTTDHEFQGLKYAVENLDHGEDGELMSLYDIEDNLDELQDVMKNILKIIESEKA